MEHNSREKMPTEKRAKQFMPFAALVGLEDALRQKEWEIETRQKLKDQHVTKNTPTLW